MIQQLGTSRAAPALATSDGRMRLAWIDKRELVPGGCERLHKEVALSPLQVSFAADPSASTRSLLLSLSIAKRRPGTKKNAPKPMRIVQIRE